MVINTEKRIGEVYTQPFKIASITKTLVAKLKKKYATGKTQYFNQMDKLKTEVQIENEYYLVEETGNQKFEIRAGSDL